MISHNKKLMEGAFRASMKKPPPYPRLKRSLKVNDQSAHLRAEGGHRQQERMIQAKRKSFDRATNLIHIKQRNFSGGCPSERHALIQLKIKETRADYDR